MRYFTRDYYGKAAFKSIIPNCLDVIPEKEYDFPSLMQRKIKEYAVLEAFADSVKKEGRPDGYISGTNMAMAEYEHDLRLIDLFLDADVKNQIRDVKVLALRFVTRREEKLLMDWASEFEAYAAKIEQEYDDHLRLINDRLPPSVIKFLSCYFFDMRCKKAVWTPHKFTLVYDDNKPLMLHFKKAENVRTEGVFDFLLAREAYLNEDGSCNIQMLFKAGEISLDCIKIGIADKSVWPVPAPGDVLVGKTSNENIPRAGNTKILDDCK